MSSTNPNPSVHSMSESAQDATPPATAEIQSLSRAVYARKAEYTRPHRMRIKVGSWNVAACPGTDKDLASWFVDGRGLEPQFDSNLARLHLSEDSVLQEESADGQNATAGGDGSQSQSTVQSDGFVTHGEEPKVHLLGGDKVGLYVLGLQEVVNLNLVHQSFYSDPTSIAKWQDALEAALPRGYTLVASHQLVGLLLLMYASPEVAASISNESTTSIGTGVFGYMGNKGAVSSRILLGETTRLAFVNAHLASGHDQTSLDRRCWDYSKILSQTKFAPISIAGVSEDEEEKLGDEDFTFFFGDLNFRLDGLPGDDIRRLLTLHARGEYDIGKKSEPKRLGGEDGVIVLRDNDNPYDGSSTPRMVSRETSFDDDGQDDESVELPDPDDFVPDAHDDPASLQATLDSLLPHDQLTQMIKQRKAFHEGWREGSVTFLPTYKYDVGTVGLFDSSEKKRAPSWCDRILYRTRKTVQDYEKMVKEEAEAKKKDEDMKKIGLEQAVTDEDVLFDYDPGTDSSAENLSSGDALYDYDEYDDGAEDESENVVTKEGFVDKIDLDIYTSHQRVMSSDHKPLVAMFTLQYDAVVPDLKAKIHAEVAWELDRAENEGRPVITVVVDGSETESSTEQGLDFGPVGFLRKARRTLTIANTGRVPAHLSFVEKPGPGEDEVDGSPEWLYHSFIQPLDDNENEGHERESLGNEITLDPGEIVGALIEVDVHDLTQVGVLNEGSTQLEDVLVLRVTDGRDHFLPVRAAWLPTCFGRSLEELIRIPRGGIRALAEQTQKGGSIRYSMEVHNSSPAELFKLTEAVETLAERAVADENMLNEFKIPRDVPGWPFVVVHKGDDNETPPSSPSIPGQSQPRSSNAEREAYRAAIVQALEEDRPISDAVHSDVPTLERLELVSEVLLLFLRSMTDGVVTPALWARIEQAIPNPTYAPSSSSSSSSSDTATTAGTSSTSPTTATKIITKQVSSKSAVSSDVIEEEKTAILDTLATAPYNNISFVFLMSMLTKVANEIHPLSKAEEEALATRSAGLYGGGSGGAGAGIKRAMSVAGGGLFAGLRRGTSSAGTSSTKTTEEGAGGKVDETAIHRRLVWERQVGEVFGSAICRPGGVADNTGTGGSSSRIRSNSVSTGKNIKARDDRARGIVEVFLRRREGP